MPEFITNIVNLLPIWAWGAIAAGFLLLLVVIVALARRGAFRRRLRAAVAGEEARLAFHARYNQSAILRRSRLIESEETRGEGAVAASGIAQLWLERLTTRPRVRDLDRLLRLAPDAGLFTCFRMSLGNPALSKRFVQWMETENDVLIIHRIAAAGRGEHFDTRAALEMLRDSIDSLRETCGAPEWPQRYMASSIVLEDGSDRSHRVLWDALSDPYPLIRSTVAERFQPADTDRLVAELKRLYLDDPVPEVRSTAKARLLAEFPEQALVEASELTVVQTGHVLGLLSRDRDEDRNLALEVLAGDNLELRLPAALFLESAGVLTALLQAADFADDESLSRTRTLLQNAASVSVTGYLSSIRGQIKPAVLSVSLSILENTGDRGLIDGAARAVFGMTGDFPEFAALYEQAVRCLAARPTEAGIGLLREELIARAKDQKRSAVLFHHLPAVAVPALKETFVRLLRDEDFVAFDDLIHCLSRLEVHELAPDFIRIVRAGRDGYPHLVRIRALKALGAFGFDYALQFLLENLSVLPLQDARDFAELLAQNTGKLFDERVGELLAGYDGNIRAAVIAALPATERKGFLKQIRAGLNDADPEVRVASVWSLVGFNDTKSLTEAMSRLRDPVQRVREETARAVAAHGAAALVEQLAEVIADEQEVLEVKEAALIGLGESTLKASADVLVNAYESQEDLRPQIVAAMALKTPANSLRFLIEHLKDAGPELRDGITEAFKQMGEAGERSMVNLLDEDIESLRDNITSSLEATGFVERMVRQLGHRDAQQRRDAAAFLARIATRSAFRGIVLAARDPDQDVRVEVTRALEALDRDGGQDLLESLKNDPDRRVRKYTLWALERIRSRSL